jgi:hypothetical protein
VTKQILIAIDLLMARCGFASLATCLLGVHNSLLGNFNTGGVYIKDEWTANSIPKLLVLTS